MSESNRRTTSLRDLSPSALAAAVCRSTPTGLAAVGFDGRLIYVNEALCRMMGYSAEELVGCSPPFPYWSPEFATINGSFIQALIEGKIVRGYECMYRRRNGEEFCGHVEPAPFLDEEGRQLGYIAAITDSSQIKAAAEERVRLRMAVEASGEAIYLTDRNGIFTYVNPEFTRLYGYAASEVLGKATPRILKSGRRSPDEYAAFWRTILAGRVLREEIVNRTRSGELVWIESSVSPLIGANGAITGFLAIQRDVSERRKLTEQLVQAQKMEAVGRLAGGVAHDFNNILSVIMSAAEFIGEEAEPGRSREDLDEILKAARRAAALTRQLLVFSRRELPKPTVVDLNVVQFGLEKLLRRTIGEDVTLECLRAPGPLMVKADPGHLEQVIMNLVINARDATPAGGTITVSNTLVSFDEGSELPGGRAPGLYALVKVADTGTGMSSEVVARVFDPFFTTKPAGKGTGLGLSIVYGIVQEAQGHVEVHSEPGRGTTVCVYLPVTDEGTTDSSRTPQPCPAGEGEVVLLVEDEDAVLTLTRRLLVRYGYEVIEARDGQHALSLFELHRPRVRVLLTDVVMPHMSGVELAQKLRGKRPGLNVVFMSGYLEGIDVEAIAAMGAELVAKPIARDRLLGALRVAAGGARHAGHAAEGAAD